MWGDDAGRCVILSCNGQRTMRTCVDTAERLSVDDISSSDFQGCKWVFLSGYILYRQDLNTSFLNFCLPLHASDLDWGRYSALPGHPAWDPGLQRHRALLWLTMTGLMQRLISRPVQAGPPGEGGGAGRGCGCQGGARPGVL